MQYMSYETGMLVDCSEDRRKCDFMRALVYLLFVQYFHTINISMFGYERKLQWTSNSQNFYCTLYRILHTF
jgi:hypothetical protein